MQPLVIHETPDFIALDKPAGLSMHAGAGAKVETLADWLLANYPEVATVGDNPKERPGIVHRLDKDTSGVLIVARTEQAFEDLKKLFQSRSVEKTYLALVAGAPKPPSGTINLPIGRSIRDPLRQGTRNIRSARDAVTEYKTLERLGEWSLIEARPKTGRMHQIRVHFSALGHPIAGDKTYGGKRTVLHGLERQFLHAAALSFSYPEGRRWRFEAPLPTDLTEALDKLRNIRNNSRRGR